MRKANSAGNPPVGINQASNSLSRRSPSLIARSDSDNRSYRVSNAVEACSGGARHRLVARGCAEGLPLPPERERKRRKKGHKSDPLI